MSEPQSLDWNALVIEARRRRARDGLTQIGHANLAGVSATTIRSFDNFERTISVEKASAILKVVGLLADERDAGRAGEDFIVQSLARWKTLAESLPPDDPARLQHGYYSVSYELAGQLSPTLTTSTEMWLKILRGIPLVSVWPPFSVTQKPKMATKFDETHIESWLESPRRHEDELQPDVSKLDYWRVLPSGVFFTTRGYWEDGAGIEGTEPGTVIDLRRPAYRAGDVLEHARLVIDEINRKNLGKVTSVKFNAVWTGLATRALVDWSSSSGGYLHGRRYVCRLDYVRSAVEADSARLNAETADVLREFTMPVYQAFGFDDRQALQEILEERDERLSRERWAGRGRADRPV
jgi:transcriptional regulator with XRE-family HTH domain